MITAVDYLQKCRVALGEGGGGVIRGGVFITYFTVCVFMFVFLCVCLLKKQNDNSCEWSTVD